MKNLVLIPVAALLIVLAVANRHSAIISLNPFVEGDPALTFNVPVFWIIFASVALGILIGGVATWSTQGKYRKSMRQNRKEAKALRAEAEQLKRGLKASSTNSLPHPITNGWHKYEKVPMRVISAPEINAVMDLRSLIETVRQAYRSSVVSPPRCYNEIERPDCEANSHLLISSSWNNFKEQGSSERGFIGTTLSTFTPSGSGDGQAHAVSVYLLQSGKTGAPLAVLDSSALAPWKEASVNALASSYLAREDASKMLVIGVTPNSQLNVLAQTSVRTLHKVLIWDNETVNASKLAASLCKEGIDAAWTDDLEGAAQGADIIILSSFEAADLLNGGWIPEGCHISTLQSPIGDYPNYDPLLLDTSRFFIESHGAHNPISREVTADLGELCKGSKAGRRYYGQRTIFENSFAAIPDLATASYAFLRS
ncbi:lipopolysaccharide assembly protein LapA domain-containing protein [Flexibacterium corallicola]|uniref:lipopolysaccharide assembly protein LapA domain-containing protein n=1 Tax=Flexibacterium corallicola TaxID=3037259 RepID=UPI00286ED4B6|nr:lipopolysaccharide assembly protein LapA domain-containing protein [Pseudovibrio sp. M1P-2-3]